MIEDNYVLDLDYLIEPVLNDKQTNSKSPNKELNLEIIVSTIFSRTPSIQKKLTQIDKELYISAVNHAIISYGNKKRKLGNYYFNHPLQVAKIIAEAYEIVGPDKNMARNIIGALYHDVIEESVAPEIASKISIFQKVTLNQLSQERKRAFLLFSEMATNLRRIGVPNYPENLPPYKDSLLRFVYLKGFTNRQNPKVTKYLRGELTMVDLQRFFEALDFFVPAVGNLVETEERRLVDQQLELFEKELQEHYGNLVDFDESIAAKLCMVPDDLRKMTRVGSEIYYTTTKKLVLNDDPNPLIQKFADRLANTRDMDYRERDKSDIHYFMFFPDVKPEKLIQLYRNYEDFLLEDQLNSVNIKRKRKRMMENEVARILPSVSLKTLLEISPEEQNFDGIKQLELAVYKTIRENNHKHEIINAIERRSKKKSRLPPHNRLFQLYKNIILVQHTRLAYEKRRKQPIIAYLINQLLMETKIEAAQLIDGTFSNHCLGRSRFTLQEARKIYHDLDEYEQYGRFDKITSENQEINRSQFQFDGLLKRFFDMRIKGEKTATYSLYTEKRSMFATALAVHKLADKYLQDPNYTISGLTLDGLEPVE